MTTQVETEVTSAQLNTRCALIQIVTSEPLVYALDVSFGSDILVWQQTSTPIARFLMDNYTIVSTMGDSTKEFIKEMQAQYQYNQTQKDQLQEQRRTIMCAHEGFRAVSEAFADEALSRGWCSEAEEFIDNVNAQIPSPFALTPMTREYCVDVTLEVTSYVTVSTTVTARDESDAASMVQDDFSAYFDNGDIREAMHDSEVSDYNIQEVDANEA
ncbi:MAG: hypothetical protein JW384_02329 [Nitrosomonadaceae bacterium]|nr:hypothetical protein [Nitrosomonadaceae bacterium]